MTNVAQIVANRVAGKDLVIGVDSNQKERPTPKQPRAIKFK